MSNNKEIKQLYKQQKKESRILVEGFIEEITKQNPDWVKNKRLEFLEKERDRLEKEKNHYYKIFLKCSQDWFQELIFDDYINKINKKQYYIKKEIDGWKTQTINEDDLSADDIERASEADCSQFLEIEREENNRSWAICPFHPDHNPSLCCYEEGKGFFCFSCQKGGDAIFLVQELYHYSFPQAVKFILKKGV